jgi:hypothetical protein
MNRLLVHAGPFPVGAHMLDWNKKDAGRPDHPLRNPAEAAKLLAAMRGAEPLAALSDLSAWLDAAKEIPGDDEKLRSDILSLIQEASATHLSKLLAQFLAKPSAQQAPHESAWNALHNYLRALADALCASAGHLLQQAQADASLQLAAAAGAARGLHACRLLAKLYLVHYQSVPPKLWQLAYGVHGDAERAGCAATPVRMHAAHKTSTSVTQELLRLLLLQSSAPEMMAPEQIEVADRVTEQLGEHFTLRPPGAADNVFCFDPAGDRPPHRAAGAPDGASRYFGAGMAYDELQRLYRELATARAADIRIFGKDIAPHVQMSAARHLLVFWGQANPYAPPARSPATGSLRVIHGYAQVWQHLSRVRSAKMELSLAEDGDGPPQAPETWTLQDTGGNELGAEIPQRSGAWARSGDVLAVSAGSDEECWLGVIRAMHAEPGGGMHANIAVLSRAPQAVQLRPVIAKDEVNIISEDAARQFSFPSVRAIIVSDGAAGSQKANFLLAPDHWEEGRVYEGTVAGSERQLRGLQLLRRADDYVRATFEWVEQA